MSECMRACVRAVGLCVHVCLCLCVCLFGSVLCEAEDYSTLGFVPCSCCLNRESAPQRSTGFIVSLCGYAVVLK